MMNDAQTGNITGRNTIASALTNIVTGKEDANFSSPNGKYNFFTCSSNTLKCDEYAFNASSILIAGNGEFNVKHYTGKFNAYQRTYVLIPDLEYYALLYLASMYQIKSFKSAASGSIVKFITKGDIENMKEKINEQEIKKFNYYGNIFTVHLVITLLSAVSLFFWLERLAFIPFGILFVITMYWALKVEKVKKDNDIQTYKEIVAFSEGKRLDEIQKQREIGKRPYQNVLKMIVAAIVAIVVCFLIGLLFHLLGN